MRFRFRKSFRFGSPKCCVRWHVSQRGYTGWSLKVWRWTYSNSTNTQTFDTPGPGSLHWGGRKRGTR
jgi:hypothetical protein